LSIGVPNVLNLGATYAQDPTWEYGVQGGWLPLVISGKTFTEWNFDFLVRYHPSEGPFYLGMNLRYMGLQMLVPTSLLGQTDPDPANASTLTANVARYEWGFFIGWRWIHGQFTIGTEVGIQVPVYARASVVASGAGLSAAQIASLQDNGKDTLMSYVYYVLPMVNLIKIGWRF
jgi:hypothetical protein